MPLTKAGPYEVDCWEVGAGSPVVLVHSSASGNRQWRHLVDEQKHRHRLVAVNLFGYGGSSPWPAARPQTLSDQAALVVAAASVVPAPLVFVGHSLGAAVALEAALRLGRDVRQVIVFGPILFYLLHSRDPGPFAEIEDVAARFRQGAAAGQWDAVARLFIDYWSGAGTWDALADDRKAAILPLLPPVTHEWNAVLTGTRSLSAWGEIKAPVHVIRAADTRRPTHVLAAMLATAHGWRLHEVAEGGHMAPVSRPDLVNPLMARLLGEVATAPAPKR